VSHRTQPDNERERRASGWAGDWPQPLNFGRPRHSRPEQEVSPFL
jgi:hypothetical protein